MNWRNCFQNVRKSNSRIDTCIENEIKYATLSALFHMGGGGGGGEADSTRPQVVFLITSVKDATEPQNL